MFLLGGCMSNHGGSFVEQKARTSSLPWEYAVKEIAQKQSVVQDCLVLLLGIRMRKLTSKCRLNSKTAASAN